MPRKNAAMSQLLISKRAEAKDKEQEEEEGEEEETRREESIASNYNTMTYYSSDHDPVTCMSILNYTCTKRASDPKLSDISLHWRESQRAGAAQISRHLRSRWALDDLVDGHLARLRTHYTQSMLPCHPADVPRLLFPPWNPPFLTSSISWLGDTFRPSSILSLIVPTLSASSLSPRTHKLLAESMRRFRVQEAVLDEEMAEYRSMSVLNLPFGPRRSNTRRKRSSGVEIIHQEMKKMEGVIAAAQMMRYRAVEVAVKGLMLDKAQAAEFLVAFMGIQETIHRQAAKLRTRAGAVAVTIQAFDAGHCW